MVLVFLRCCIIPAFIFAGCQMLQDDLDFQRLLQPLPGTVDTTNQSLSFHSPSVLEDEEEFVWGGAVIRGEDGQYHMFYSVFDGDLPMSQSWVLTSRIDYAVSERPVGPFRFQKTFLSGAGEQGNPEAWDARSVHNPHIRRFNDRVYLYHSGSAHPGRPEAGQPGAETSERDLVQLNQKIGVIVAGSVSELVHGPVQRAAQPLLTPRTRVAGHTFHPSPEGTEPLPDNLIIVNPSVVRRPEDGLYLLYFKGNIYDPGWRGAHGIAFGPSPTGPFQAQDNFLFEVTLADWSTSNNAEDPYVWYDLLRQRFYAILKDFTGQIAGQKSCLVLFTSEDGLDWQPARHPLVSLRQLVFEDGTVIDVHNLERPQLLLDENGQPQMLYVACKPGNGYAVKGPTSNVHISLMGQ